MHAGVCIRLRETIARLFPAELRQRQEEVALQLQQQQEAEQRRLLEQQQHQQAYMPGGVTQPRGRGRCTSAHIATTGVGLCTPLQISYQQ
jgi:hypothetical protein